MGVLRGKWVDWGMEHPCFLHSYIIVLTILFFSERAARREVCFMARRGCGLGTMVVKKGGEEYV
jgi:hypothetical protein